MRAYTAFLDAVLSNPIAARVSDATDAAAWVAADLGQHAAACIAWLRTQGVFLDDWARPHRLAQANPLDPFAIQAAPLTKRQRLWKSLLADLLADAMQPQIPYLPHGVG